MPVDTPPDLDREVLTKRDRAKRAIQALFDNEKEAAEAIGIPYSTLRRALRPENNPTVRSRTLADRLDEVGAALLGRTRMSEAWWEGGEEPVLEPEMAPPAPSHSLPASDFRGAPGTPTGPPVGYTRIPMVTIEPAASGEGNELDVEIEEVEGDTLLPDWWIVQEYGMSPERIRHVRVRGDSMIRTIQPGQVLVIGLVSLGHILADGHVYVFRGPTGVLIKRLYLEPDHVHVWSDNKKAPRYRVPLEVWSRDYRVAAVALQINQKL